MGLNCKAGDLYLIQKKNNKNFLAGKTVRLWSKLPTRFEMSFSGDFKIQ